MADIKTPPNQEPILKNGQLSNEWMLWFQGVYDAIKGLQNEL